MENFHENFMKILKIFTQYNSGELYNFIIDDLCSYSELKEDMILCDHISDLYLDNNKTFHFIYNNGIPSLSNNSSKCLTINIRNNEKLTIECLLESNEIDISKIISFSKDYLLPLIKNNDINIIIDYIYNIIIVITFIITGMSKDFCIGEEPILLYDLTHYTYFLKLDIPNEIFKDSFKLQIPIIDFIGFIDDAYNIDRCNLKFAD